MHGRGFTMVELIVVIVLVGAIAAFAVPKFTSPSEFDARGFSDQAMTMVRYAQKLAISQRRDVWVQIDQATGNICLTYVGVDANCATNSLTATNPVLDPDGRAWYKRTAPRNVSFSASLSFNFNGLGRPIPNSSKTINIVGGGSTNSIIVESETGYVHP